MNAWTGICRTMLAAELHMNRSDWLILNVDWARQIPDWQPSGHRNADSISNANTSDTGLILQLLHMEEAMGLWENPN